MALIDISPAVSPSTPVFPGDTAFSAIGTWNFGGECPVNVSKFETTTHIGAHADAPLHYINGGAPIDRVALDAYIGPCTLVHAIGIRNLLTADELAERIGARRLNERLLIRFYERAPQAEWDAQAPAIERAAIHLLADRGVILIGVDTASLDPPLSKLMDAHRAIGERDMRVLEGLVLDDVAEGDYELIAPPLKLAGLDAAPVRAVLRTIA
ncbi:MAG: arylformamidase [Parvularculaceae bacterium]|nr:arylformamidase [Parvularculaceae bacterium]